MTIRIHEADGTPYEHVLDIRSPFKRYEVPFNTKYKRVRRNTKRYLARQAAAQAAAEGDAEAAEAIGMVDMGFGLEIWENEQERENWKVADWTEEDENVMSGATYEWIRIDADFEWIANMKFEQPDFMWVSQLQRDRDVVAQLEVRDPSKHELSVKIGFRHFMLWLRNRPRLSRVRLRRLFWFQTIISVSGVKLHWLSSTYVESYFEIIATKQSPVRNSKARFPWTIPSLQVISSLLL